MPAAAVTESKVFEDGSAAFMARIVGNDAANITQASLTGIVYSVFDIDGPTPDTALSGHSAEALVVANVVFDALQTDARWTVDSTGYNFRHPIATATSVAFPTGGHRYRIEYLFNPGSGEDFFVVFKVEAVVIHTS